MFDRIVIRRTTPHSSPDPLDLGRLAETMLFYRKVHLTVSRAGLDQLLRQCGPAVVIDLVENWNVDFAYLNADIAVRNEGVGTPRMRHQPVTITNLSEPYEQWIVHRFQEVVGRTGAGRRLANRFLKHARPFALTTGLVAASRNDWEDEGFVERAIAEVIRAVAPTYQQPETLRFKLVDAGDQYFSLDSNINWTALERARVTESTDDTLTPGHLLLNLATMREEIQLAAALDAQLATDALGWALIKTKCADLLTTGQPLVDRFRQLWR